ncbi:KGG domain-containing protein [Mesorhizobium sp. IMUNJ 23232]|uniref:KGG domain-containing protein n=1 Tax=Mesorhizobium sp. IMUNJ 23232 TaxID=3376064 RepID=UPI00379E0031
MANQGGSRDQHVKAGQQSHKNDDSKQQGAEGGSGGQQGSGQRGGQQGGSERGGSGNFANDREKASEAGRKGGKS